MDARHWTTYAAARTTQPEAAQAFLGRSINYLLIAYVAEAYRRRGVGGAFVPALAQITEERDYRDMFVLTNESNEPAMRLYASVGGWRNEERDIVMFEWCLDQSQA